MQENSPRAQGAPSVSGKGGHRGPSPIAWWPVHALPGKGSSTRPPEHMQLFKLFREGKCTPFAPFLFSQGSLGPSYLIPGLLTRGMEESAEQCFSHLKVHVSPVQNELGACRLWNKMILPNIVCLHEIIFLSLSYPCPSLGYFE